MTKGEGTMNTATQNTIHSVANYLITELKKWNIVIQRYDAYNNILLKLDYGVANSVFIGERKPKEGLSYRYQLLSCCPYPIKTQDSEGYIRYYYPLNEVHQLINLILTERNMKIEKYGKKKYRTFMDINMAENQNKVWRKSVVI